jgi:hypothetical protein
LKEGGGVLLLGLKGWPAERNEKLGNENWGRKKLGRKLGRKLGSGVGNGAGNGVGNGVGKGGR